MMKNATDLLTDQLEVRVVRMFKETFVNEMKTMITKLKKSFIERHLDEQHAK